MNTSMNIEQIIIPEIESTIINGGISNFLTFIITYYTIPNITIAITVGILHDAIGA